MSAATSANPAAAFYATPAARLVGATLRLAHRWSPALATRLALQLFFTPLPGKQRARARAVPARVCERDVLRLDDHDAAAHLLLHHVQHYFDRRLKWALDLRRIVGEPGFRWSTVAERLRQWGGRGAAGQVTWRAAR